MAEDFSGSGRDAVDMVGCVVGVGAVEAAGYGVMVPVGRIVGKTGAEGAMEDGKGCGGGESCARVGELGPWRRGGGHTEGEREEGESRRLRWRMLVC